MIRIGPRSYSYFRYRDLALPGSSNSCDFSSAVEVAENDRSRRWSIVSFAPDCDSANSSYSD